MSTFAVKAISKNKIRLLAAKRFNSADSVDEVTDIIFSGDKVLIKEIGGRPAKPSVVSPFYDSPQFARDNLEKGLAAGDYRDASIVCKVAGRKGAKKVTRVINWSDGMSYSESLDAAGLMPL